MADNKGTMEMALGSWLVALAVGTLAAVLLWLLGGWGFMQGAFIGAVVFGVFGVVISWIMTRPLPGPIAMVTAPADLVQAPSAQQPTSEPESEPVPAAPKAQPTTRLPGQEELAARKGEWTYEKEADETPAPKKTAAKKAPAQKSAPVAASGNRPAALTDVAREGGADDLKLIGGVGPKLEETLNSLGIWHFDQVAGLKKKDIAWVDERLRFKGRIERDDWVGQAKVLAKGGETEFSKKKRKS